LDFNIFRLSFNIYLYFYVVLIRIFVSNKKLNIMSQKEKDLSQKEKDLTQKEKDLNMLIGMIMSGQSRVIYKGIEVYLPILKRDTYFRREQQAKEEALKIYNLLNF